ncbi:hypothetical protein E1890_16960 [Salmonella enterica subsp. enterica serovar Mountpleasant]|nr:hypothetical protein [Salmonella enterica subsp. enterica serovar Mountpleasant]
MEKKPTDTAVMNKLKELQGRMFEICESNKIPLVIGLEYVTDSDEHGVSTNKAVSAYIDRRNGVWESTIASAALILGMGYVPEHVINLLAQVSGIGRKTEQKSTH